MANLIKIAGVQKAGVHLNDASKTLLFQHVENALNTWVKDQLGRASHVYLGVALDLRLNVQTCLQIHTKGLLSQQVLAVEIEGERAADSLVDVLLEQAQVGGVFAGEDTGGGDYCNCEGFGRAERIAACSMLTNQEIYQKKYLHNQSFERTQ